MTFAQFRKYLNKLSSRDLYILAKRLISIQYFTGKCSKKYEAVFDECEARNPVIIRDAMNDAILSVGSCEFCGAENIINIKRIDHYCPESLMNNLHNMKGGAKESRALLTAKEKNIMESNESFICTYRGDRMEGLNINDGDLLLIDARSAPADGEYAAAYSGTNLIVGKMIIGETNTAIITNNTVVCELSDDFVILGAIRQIFRNF